jgi:hypothetical protein
MKWKNTAINDSIKRSNYKFSALTSASRHWRIFDLVGRGLRQLDLPVGGQATKESIISPEKSSAKFIFEARQLCANR